MCLTSRRSESSPGSASAQDNDLWNGVGEGAGVGGEAGADGSIFIGNEGCIVVDIRFGPVAIGLDLAPRVISFNGMGCGAGSWKSGSDAIEWRLW